MSDTARLWELAETAINTGQPLDGIGTENAPAFACRGAIADTESGVAPFKP